MRSSGIIFAVVAAVIGFSNLARANDAGCGLGSMIIDKNTKVSQTFASTTNISTYTQLFGITSGTSNCTANGFAVQERKAEIFADTNMKSLKVDMARGQGESLKAFAQLLGCTDASLGAFGQMTRSNYETIFPSSEVKAADMLHTVEGAMVNNPALSKGCFQAI